MRVSRQSTQPSTQPSLRNVLKVSGQRLTPSHKLALVPSPNAMDTVMTCPQASPSLRQFAPMAPTPVTAVLTVPQETDAVVTVTVEEVITEPGLTTTRLVTKTCANGPCLPDITAAAIPGADRLTINGGTIVLPVTVTKTETDKTTATEKETATVTTTSDSNEFNPNGFNSGAGHMIPSNKSMVFAMSAFALLFLLSA